jgi:hypothetical protein
MIVSVYPRATEMRPSRSVCVQSYPRFFLLTLTHKFTRFCARKESFLRLLENLLMIEICLDYCPVNG